jgi:PHP family Zn ribbon phosphoesterase
MRVREGKLKIEPGYDGEYGKVKIFDEKERESFSKQSSLF